MKYKFEIRAAIVDEELQKLLDATADGLEGTCDLTTTVTVDVNTELPADKVKILCKGVEKALTLKLGNVKAVLVSQEH